MKHLLSYLLLPFLLFTSCDSWLDVVPEEDIATIDSEFETYDQAYVWLKVLMPICKTFMTGGMM